MIYDRRYELMPRAELEQLQLERLQALLVRLRRTVRRYRELLGDVRVESLADIGKLPMTTPEAVAESFPYGMFALPLREVIRLDSSVGPDGRPLVTSFTTNDMDHWGRLVARQFVAAGMTANDIIMVCLGGINWGASGIVRGAELIEATVIAEEPYHVNHQLAMLSSFRPTVLVTTPYNAHNLAVELERRQLDPQSLSLRTVLLSRPVGEAQRETLHAGLFAEIRCSFGVGEVLDPGFCVECAPGRFHANEDHFLVEVVDGELVVTTLCREAMPLLRYRTRVACEIVKDKCACGRTGLLFRPAERLDGRLYVAEIPIYEKQMQETLEQIGLAGHKFAAHVREHHIDIELEVNEELFRDTVHTLNQLCNRVQSEFHARFGIEARVRPVTPRR